ncbi:MAG: DUF4294 domain-containing protein [Bacteroidales bacterium]
MRIMKRALMKNIIFILAVVAPTVVVFGQIKDTSGVEDKYLLKTVVINGDTIASAKIDEIVVYPELDFDNKREYRRYKKMVRDLKKVYPYAQKAKYKLIQMNEEFTQLETEIERKKYIKNVESELKDEFKDDLKKLTVTQGHYLLKLIDRETGDTSYELLQELKGNFSAVFWQTIARIFGHNLRSEYDPHGDDRLMERIVILIEHDQI